MSKKRYTRSVPGTRYMSVRMGQLRVADIREVFPGDFIKYRCRIGVHLSPLQAPELSPLIIRQDQFFVENRILWNYWDNYISQKLLDDSAVGPFAENQLIPPQLYVLLGSGNGGAGITNYNYGHMGDVRGVYDLLEDLGARFSYTDTFVGPGAIRFTGSIANFNAFPLMGYWRIWHCFYRDAYLQNDEFKTYTVDGPQGQRMPLDGDPWADESPVTDDMGTAQQQSQFNWNSPLSSLSAFSTGIFGYGKNFPGYTLSWSGGGNNPRHPMLNTRGIFTFYRRQPAASVGILGSDAGSSIILPGAAAVCPLDLTVRANETAEFQESPGGLFFCAPVNMPKDYVFTARQSPVYNEDVMVPDSVRDLRKAFQVLGYREKVNRFDNRIKAWLWNMFHVNTSDKRLCEPLWLHGAQSIINTQEILGTVNNTDTVLGQLGGFGIGAVKSRMIKMRAESHGFLYTLFYINPVPIYGDGVRRYWWRGRMNLGTGQPVRDGSLDWPIPDFARIGQQELYVGEVAFNGRNSDQEAGPWATAGYTDRFSELDFSNADVCGDFRTTLRFWHTGLFFGNKQQTSSSDELNPFAGVDGNFISLFPRNRNNLRGIQHLGQSISEALSQRLFDAGNAADQFWCVVSSDYYVSSRIPSHPHPGYADHTSAAV